VPKGVAKDALANSGTANSQASTLSGNAASTYGSLAPTLATEAAHPQGYTPAQQAAQNTAAQQSAGGSNAATVGQGALLASRTRNAGAAQNAIAQGGRQASENLSNAAVGTQVNNANLQQKQQQAGIQGEQQLYGTTLGGGMNALGLSNQSLGVAGQADANNPWMKLAQQAIQSAGQAGAAAGG
jgi:hypothetical protein